MLLLQIIEHAEAVKRANELDNELDLLKRDQEGLRRAAADAESAKVCLTSERACSLACERSREQPHIVHDGRVTL